MKMFAAYGRLKADAPAPGGDARHIAHVAFAKRCSLRKRAAQTNVRRLSAPRVARARLNAALKRNLGRHASERRAKPGAMERRRKSSPPRRRARRSSAQKQKGSSRSYSLSSALAACRSAPQSSENSNALRRCGWAQALPPASSAARSLRARRPVNTVVIAFRPRPQDPPHLLPLSACAFRDLRCRAPVYSLTRCSRQSRALFPFALSSAGSKVEPLKFVRCAKLAFTLLTGLAFERRDRLPSIPSLTRPTRR